MQLIKCVDAYIAIKILCEKEWDYKTAYELVKIKRRLQPHADFFVEQEKKLTDECAAKDEKGNIIWSKEGTFKLKDAQAGERFVLEREKLGQIEVGEKIEPVTIRYPDRISPAMLEALDGFVNFKEEDNT